MEPSMTEARTATTKSKNDRLELRLASQAKDLLSRAATVRGQSVSEFVTASALLRARKILASEESIVLSETDSEIFFKALDNPPEPVDALKKAFSRHKKIVKTGKESAP